MRWDDHDELKKLIEKIESGANLTRDEINYVLLILTKDAWDRGLE